MEKYYFGTGITIVIFLVSHLCLAVWFASRINTKVSVMTESIKKMAEELKSLAALDKRLAVLEQRMSRAETDMREVIKAAALLNP